MRKEKKPFLVVGIGASAGGLAVLKAFVKSLPEKTGMAFIIIQHLDPTHKSMLSELLAKVSALPVQDAEDSQRIESDHIYVIPPDTYLELKDGKIKLTEPEHARGSRKAIDYFFRSLARECGNRCAGLVFSGSGSDGTAGLRAIKAAGGLALAQDPNTAEHASMPLSAIDADVIDKAVPVEEMPELLKQYADHPLTRKEKEDQPEPDAGTEDSFAQITAILKTHEHLNVKQYKPATVQRRIARRISLTNTGGYQEYLDKLRHNADERKQLAKDLLIKVTDFFRDPEAFEVLEQKVVPATIDNLEDNEEIRVWVAGCASGEEAYSLAILLLEALAKARRKNSIKIFATDIDAHAIKIARKGLYPESIAGEVPKKYLEKYFTKVENNPYYQIKNSVRDLISFAVQNVAVDPPFSHMHLISCRNLLIYFKKDVQDKILSSFYFALEDAAHLFLGSSENISSKNDLFKTVSKKWRIYQKIPGRDERKVSLQHLYVEKNTTGKKDNSVVNRKNSQASSSRSEQMRRSLLDTFLPPGVIVDNEGRILYNHGNWKSYMAIPTGEPCNDIGQLVLPVLRSRIRSALYKVRKSKAPLSFHCAIPLNDKESSKKMVRVDVSPLVNQTFTEEEAIGIVFYEGEPLSDEQQETLTKDDEVRASQHLEQELAETKEELQNTIEELETSTEELKASHEEALSTNEELQSANEELEASAEELRSLNEELSTVNAQLKDKIAQLQKANDDVENFFASTDVPILFLDPELHIQRYTPAAEQLLKLGPRDIDHPIQDLGRDLVDDDLVEECNSVLQNFRPISKEVQTDNGNWYIRHIMPYRTEVRRIEGVVLVFQDVTDIKALSRRAESREQQQAVVANLGMLALGGMEPQELMHQAVRQIAHTLHADYCKILKYQPEENNLLLVAGVGWQEGLVGKATVLDNQASQAGYTLLSREPVIVKQLSEEKRFTGPALLIDHQVVSGISCRINYSQLPYGVLGVHTKQYREFTRDDANFLVAVANMLSTALTTRDTQEKLYNSEEQFRTLANAIPQLAWITDETGYIYWYNQRWYEYTGTTLETMKGWGWQKVHHPDHVERVVAKIKRSFETGEEWEDTFPLRSKDGEYRWFLSRAKPIRKQSGEIIHWFGTNTDITEQLEQEKALRDSEERLRMAKESSHFGVFDYDITNNAIEWDQMLKDIWGVAPDEPITLETFFRSLHPEDIENTEKAIIASLNPDGDGHYHIIYRVVHPKTKNRRWIEANGQVTFVANEPVRMVGMVMDITQRKELEESLHRVVKELQETDLKKTEFLSILGHELRNPLAALTNSIEILTLKRPELTDVIHIMKRSVGTMARLLDDLLDLNRITQNKVQLDLQPVEIDEIMQNAVTVTRNSWEEKNHHVSLHANHPIWVNGDPTRLEQVFCNLIINACKYTPEGGNIALRADQADSKVRVYVQDNGIGLERKIIDKIFDPFFQAFQEGKAASGLGIGLALSKKLVELHGGQITAHSEGKNQGATFIVQLPAQTQPIMDSKENTPAKEFAVKPGLKVVLIEDNGDILATVPLLLKTLGCQVKTASNAKDGLQLAREFEPDVMLIDIGLPDMSGHDIAARLRAAGWEKQLVAISGYSHKEVREKSKEVGFDYHLAKPATLHALTTILAKAK